MRGTQGPVSKKGKIRGAQVKNLQFRRDLSREEMEANARLMGNTSFFLHHAIAEREGRKERERERDQSSGSG